MLVLAASVDPFSLLVNYGALGIIVLLFVTRQIYSKGEVQAADKRAEDATKLAESRLDDLRAKDAMIAALMQQITTHTVPQLGQLANVIDALPRHTEDALVGRLTDLTRKIELIERQIGARDTSGGQ